MILMPEAFIIQLIFWLSIFVVIYYYCVYPSILLVLRSLARRLPETGSYFPRVSLLISAYNEEAVIEEKLRNALGLDYPKDRFEIIVISDCSTDGTDDIVTRYKDRGVMLLRQEERKGKTEGLNFAISHTAGEIVVFSDANSMYDSQALKNITRNFFDPGVGLVTGRTRYIVRDDNKISEAVGLYTRLESFIKGLESEIGSCVGADGAIFAVRKNLYQPLNQGDINDFVIPLNVVAQGYRCIFDKEVMCDENAARSSRGEFTRQARITNRTLRAIFNNRHVLNPFRTPLFTFMVFSHKMTRFLTPFFLLACLGFNAWLWPAHLIYKLTLIGQIFFYLPAFYGFWKERHGQWDSPFAAAYHFVLVNAAILVGWIGYMFGRQVIVWNPDRG